MPLDEAFETITDQAFAAANDLPRYERDGAPSSGYLRRFLRHATVQIDDLDVTVMRHLSITPSVSVTIGRQTRLYFAFVTTAPAELDSLATMTLHAGTFADVAGFAADAVPCDMSRARTPARLVLVNALEVAWHRAKYRGSQHLVLAADRVLVGINTLQRWLWQRLQAAPSEVHA